MAQKYNIFQRVGDATLATPERKGSDMDTQAPSRLPLATPELTSAEVNQLYNAIWQNINREDVNTSSRITWMLSLTAGEFTAIAFLLNRLGDPDPWRSTVIFAILLLSGLAIFICVRTLMGVTAARNQIIYLREHYVKYETMFTRLQLPRPYGDDGSTHGMMNAKVLPTVLLGVWCAVFIIDCVGAYKFFR